MVPVVCGAEFGGFRRTDISGKRGNGGRTVVTTSRRRSQPSERVWPRILARLAKKPVFRLEKRSAQKYGHARQNQFGMPRIGLQEPKTAAGEWLPG
jgi:hypothetical protein